MSELSASPRQVNLVFQGGGVKGIAYAGVLEKMPSNIHIHAVGGTSAGAIVAALLATGRRPAELPQLLDRAKFAAFLDAKDEARALRLANALAEGRTLWKALDKKAQRFGPYKAWRYWQKHAQTLTEDLGAVMRARGLYRNTQLRAWLDELFGEIRFDEIKVADLKIVAADTTARRFRIFTKATHGSTRIAEAVHQSVSIPVFFQPYLEGNRAIVDGGLLSNFPAYLFAQSHYPTIGFRLRDVELPSTDQDAEAYLRALLLTMVEAHDAERPLPAYFKQYDIPASSVPSTRFALTAHDQAALLQAGQTIGSNVEWQAFSSPEPIITYYDAKPQEALRDSMAQAQRLFVISGGDADRPEEFHQSAIYTVWVEGDWSARYELENELRVNGKRPMIVNRTRMSLLPTAAGAAVPSLVDYDYKHVEFKNGSEDPLVRIPCENSEDVKGYLTFFWPPLADGQDARRFKMTWSQPREFEATVGRKEVGRQSHGEISYRTRQKGDKHHLKLEIRIFVDNALPSDIVLTSSTNGLALTGSPTLVPGMAGRAYRAYVATMGGIEVRHQAKFEVLMTRRAS